MVSFIIPAAPDIPRQMGKLSKLSRQLLMKKADDPYLALLAYRATPLRMDTAHLSY